MPLLSLSVARRRWFRVALVLLLLGIVGTGAAWGWAAYHLSAARREADAQRLQSAWQHLERARLTWPVRADTHLLAASVARRLGLLDEARAHLDAHEKLGGNGQARDLERTLLLVQDGDLAEEEKDLLDKIKGGHSESGLILEALARGYLKKNHQAGLSQLLELWPDRLANSCWRGKAHHHLGNFAEAVADLTPFVAQNPDWDELRLELAQACYRAGRAGEGLAHYRHLQRRNPTSADVLLGLALCLQDQSQLDEAATALQSLLEQNPQHLIALIERGRVAFRQGQHKQGEGWARQAIALDPNAADAYLILALCLEKEGRQAEAREQQQRWQTLDAAQYHLGQVLSRLSRSPDDPNLHFQCGSALLQLGNHPMAMEAFHHALRVGPNHRPTHRLLAGYYAGLGQHELAREHERKASP